MRTTILSLLAISITGLIFYGAAGEQSVVAEREEADSAPGVPKTLGEPHRIKGIQNVEGGLWSAHTESQLFVSQDRGLSWSLIQTPIPETKVISGVRFIDKEHIWLLAAEPRTGVLELLKSRDGGATWKRNPVGLGPAEREEASLDTVEIESDGVRGRMVVRLASSSNFFRSSVYSTPDGGRSWKKVSSDAVTASDDTPRTAGGAELVREGKGIPEAESVVAVSNSPKDSMLLTQEGVCLAFKTGCLQISRLYDASGGKAVDVTPYEIRSLTEEAREAALLESAYPVAMPPGGTTRTSLNRGFDKCTAATTAQMQTWWDSSPYYDANIYMSGRNRGCTQGQLTSSWVNSVSTQGWGLIPTVVGYQSPCSVCTGCSKHSTEPATAEQQGRGEADIAVADAANIGLLAGTVLYYDMERYDDLSGTGACSTPTKAFLKGWTDRLKERGYVSGVYGSPTNAVGDWLNIPQASQPDAVWLARWDNIMSVWAYGAPSPAVPENAWANHQRIKQWKAPFNDTWGGVTFNIDGNIADGPVAGVQTRNRNGDFDGDGKADVAVFRAESGSWWVVKSSDRSLLGASFGAASDVLAPGDFDGDGRTDFAVWRPSEGVWHRYSRSIYTTYPFGAAGDIPVPADYDGDGRTDVAVFRPSTGVWYIKNSLDSRGTSLRFEQFGIAEDRPVPGDYDGDGKADLAVFRPSSGVWWVMRSSEGLFAMSFGTGTDRAVQGDYDGDGRTDPAVYRGGFWHIFGSRNGYYGFPFGAGEDKPAPADFDGDGRTDAAVFRPSTGTWYILGSNQGFYTAAFGIATDSPVPSAYIPRN